MKSNHFLLLFILVFSSFIISSCSKDNKIEEKPFMFSKQYTISDKNGNIANVEISSEIEENVLSITPNDLELVTTTVKPMANTNSNQNLEKHSKKVTKDYSKYTFIDVNRI